MGTEVKVPKIAGVLRLSVGRWFKSVGDPVSIGEPLVEIDTYNMTHEMRAPATEASLITCEAEFPHRRAVSPPMMGRRYEVETTDARSNSRTAG
jgi:Biotin-requiring enzyme